MKLLKFFLASLFVLLFFAFVYPQKKSDKNPPKPVEVKMNLLVMDDKNVYVDVKQEEVKIFEDGVEQKITYFAKKEPALNIVLAMDNSGSLRENLKEMYYIGSVIAENLREKDEAMIVRFVSSDKIETLQEWTDDKAKLGRALENMFIEGGQSAVLDAVYLSAQQLLEKEKKDKNKRCAMVLVSDGEDRASFYKYEQVLNLFKGSDAQIFMLSYASNAPNDKKVALKLSNLLPLDTGGTTFLLAKKYKREELNETLKNLVYELRSNYVVGYTSNNPKRDGTARKLTVEIAQGAKGEKRTVIAREGFTVPKD